MKKYSSIFILFLPFIVEAQCLSDDFKDFISTDPNHAVNPKRPLLKNTFDWRKRLWQVYHDEDQVGIFEQNDKPVNIANPFYSENEVLAMINFMYLASWKSGKPEYLDFHPEDGWELLYKHNGITIDGQTDPLFYRVGPLFMLYNRYTAKVRILAALTTGQPRYFLTTIEFRSIANLSISGLFGKYSGTMNALDRASTTAKVSQLSAGVRRYNFFISEFNLNYDPCICQTKTELEVSFGKVDLATLNGQSKLLGDSRNDSRNAPIYGRDFLIGFQEYNSAVGNGLVNYRNVASLLRQYETSNPSLANQNFRLAVENALSQKGRGLENLLAKPASKLPVNALTGTEIKTDTSEWTLRKSFGTLGKNAQQISIMLKPSQPIISSISFTEDKFSLFAQMRVLDAGGNEFIVVPGSVSSNTTHERFYPLYNEALGVFALLETPQVKYYSKVNSEVEVVVRARVAPKIEVDRLFQLDKNSIKYYFNPAAEVNLAKTKIYAALIINSNNCSAQNFTRYLNPISDTTFMTDFYPIAVLTQIAGYILGRPHLSCVPNSAALRFQIFYEFKPNRYGKVIKHYEVLNFAADLVNTDAKLRTSLPPQLPKNITIYGLSSSTLRTSSGNFNMTESLTLKALNNITISGGLRGLSASANLNLAAGNAIIVNNNVEIGKHVTLKSDSFDNVYGIAKSLPVSADYVKTFCSSSRYKANRFANAGFARINRESEAGKARKLSSSGGQVGEVSSSRQRKVSKVKLYPNPTTGLIHLALDFRAAQDVHIIVYSVSGFKVYEVKLTNVETTIYDLDLSGQASGLYLVSIIGTEDKFQEQVWVD